MIRVHHISTLFTASALLVACGGEAELDRPDTPAPSGVPAPTVSALSTYDASVGTMIEVYGSNFPGATQGTTQLVFTGVFDGVDGVADVYLDEQFLRTERASGLPFRIEVTGLLRAGEDHYLRVLTRPRDGELTCGGLTGGVRLLVEGPLRLAGGSDPRQLDAAEPVAAWTGVHRGPELRWSRDDEVAAIASAAIGWVRGGGAAAAGGDRAAVTARGRAARAARSGRGSVGMGSSEVGAARGGGPARALEGTRGEPREVWGAAANAPSPLAPKPCRIKSKSTPKSAHQ